MQQTKKTNKKASNVFVNSGADVSSLYYCKNTTTNAQTFYLQTCCCNNTKNTYSISWYDDTTSYPIIDISLSLIFYTLRKCIESAFELIDWL